MNDLVIPASILDALPGVSDGIRNAMSLFSRVQSFADIERIFLKGAGLSPLSYRSYLCAARQFYEHSGSQHPLQTTSGDIEGFYDALVAKGVHRNTARLRIAGLKKYFRGVSDVAKREGLAYYRSPFDGMSEKLRKKLSKTKKGNRAKKALTAAEMRRVLAFLAEDASISGLRDYAIVHVLFGSGLRAAELLQLTWADIGQDEDGGWCCVFTGKGDRNDEQPLLTESVDALRKYFRAQHRRSAQPADKVLWSLAPAVGKRTVKPMTYSTLHRCIVGVGARAAAAGIVTRPGIEWSPHLLRRTSGTVLLKAGASLVAVQHHLRHTNVQTTAKSYIDDREDQRGRLAGAIGSVPPVAADQREAAAA